MERITMRVPALLAGNLIGQERPAPMLSIGLVGGKEEKDDCDDKAADDEDGSVDDGKDVPEAVSKIRPKRPHERYAQASKRPRTYDLGPKHG
ncbi:unnamed protein product [Prorocentrum cordatum]|uniref:Uncharacterized protein n=1 Tax=Prorocentrum cordatum TaxID=2364126 RepID=A0ABN9V532_9DINO|nr:unnamed protein product [Polarella glacialis]